MAKHNESDDGCVVKPPDGGYGWVVMFACFGLTTLVDGVSFTFGVFLPSLTEHFSASKASVSLIGSLLIGTTLASGKY